MEINIPKLLSEKYPTWIYSCPQIYQIDEDGNVIKEWNNKKDVVDFYHKKIQGLDLALRKRCRFNGYFWICKILYEKEGIRPIITEKRNSPIYAYDPPDYICDNYNDYTIEDFYKKENRNKFRFIGRFDNSVSVGSYLDLSVTNIRRVAKGEIILHKGYFFSFVPLLDIHKITVDIIDLYNKSKKIPLIDEEKEILNNLFITMENYYSNNINEGRIISEIEDEAVNIYKEFKCNG